MTESSSPETVVKKLGAFALALLGFGWYFVVGMVPSDPRFLDAAKYLLAMIFLAPIIGSNFLFPRVDEKSKDQAHWFAIVCGIAAIPLAGSLSYAFLATRLH